jgi:hypothetical protein
MDANDKTLDVAKELLTRDEQALELELGLRSNKIDKAEPAERPELAADPQLPVTYEKHMGLIDDIKALGKRVALRWSKELHGLVCNPTKPEDKKLAEDIREAAGLKGIGLETALIAAVVPAILWLGAPAAIAAVVAPLVVKKFILPARDELCDAWGEALQMQQ